MDAMGNKSHIMEELQRQLRRPEGTVEFRSSADLLLGQVCSQQVLLQVVAAAQVFRIEKEPPKLLRLYHFSPGTGSRVATVDLAGVAACEEVYWGFSWSPDETNLFVGPIPPVRGGLLLSKGERTSKAYRAAKDGFVVQLGDDGVEVMEPRLFIDGQLVVGPTAREVWENTVEAVRVLLDAPLGDYRFEVVMSNLVIIMLVTGYEVYCRTRFVELEQEGVQPDLRRLVEKVFSRQEREAGEPERLDRQAREEHITFLEKIARVKINFQNYEECKKAYRAAYGVAFGAIGIPAAEVYSLKRFIEYRHRIVHVSPMIAMLNERHVPPEQPEFSNRQLARRALECFGAFVEALHKASLTLR
ncbi:MAG: hypothetical protein AB1609_21060 [Bacillota bacterium]